MTLYAQPMTPWNIFAAEAEELAALSDIAEAARYVQPLTSESVERAFALDDELNAAREQFRRKHYPRRHAVVTVQGHIFTMSATGKSDLVWKRS